MTLDQQYRPSVTWDHICGRWDNKEDSCYMLSLSTWHKASAHQVVAFTTSSILLLMNSQLQGDLGRWACHYQESLKHELGAMMFASWAWDQKWSDHPETGTGNWWNVVQAWFWLFPDSQPSTHNWLISDTLTASPKCRVFRHANDTSSGVIPAEPGKFGGCSYQLALFVYTKTD